MDMEKITIEIEDALSGNLAKAGYVYGMSLNELKDKALKDALSLLKEQEVKIAHWVSVNDGDTVAIDNDGFPERACYCSKCQKYLIASDEYAVYGRYCPFCGAKMEGW